MLEKIKVLLGIVDASKDNLLNILIDQAQDDVITYTRNPECIYALGNIICQMVIYKYNRLGTEGLNSEGYSGVSFSYTADYPAAIYKSLNRYKKVKTL